jgi:hypothetical protein
MKCLKRFANKFLDVRFPCGDTHHDNSSIERRGGEVMQRRDTLELGVGIIQLNSVP